MDYVLTLAIYFFVDLILVLSANMMLGLMGMANLGFILFLGAGAYTAAIFSLGPSSAVSLQHYFFGASLPFPVPILLALVVGALLGLITGAISLYRTRGHYLAIMTLAILTIAWSLVDGFPNFLGGSTGLALIPQPLHSLASTTIGYDVVFTIIAGVFAVLCFIFSERLFHSPLGRIAKAVRENEEAVRTLGVNPYRIRVLVTVCGGAMAALSGALLAEYTTVWGVDPWSFTEIFPVAAALIVGGRGNNWGMVLGTFLTYVLVGQGTGFLPGVSSSPLLTFAIQWIVYGVALIAFLWFRPQGMIPEAKPRWKRIPRVVADTTPPPVQVGERVGARG